MFAIEDIAKAEFDKVMRGYRPDDVHAYLEQVAAQMEKMQSDREDVEKKLYMLAQKVEEYRKEEDMLKTAMLNAQRMGESVIREAKQKAESIVREADLKANLIETKAKDRVAVQEEEFAILKAKISGFKTEVLAIYKQHIQSLSELPSDAADDEGIHDNSEEQQAEVAFASTDIQEPMAQEEDVKTYASGAPILAEQQPMAEALPYQAPIEPKPVWQDAPRMACAEQQPLEQTTRQFAAQPIMEERKADYSEKAPQYQPVFGNKPIFADANANISEKEMNTQPATHEYQREAVQSPFAVLGMEPKNFAFDNPQNSSPVNKEKEAQAPESIFDKYHGVNFND